MGLYFTKGTFMVNDSNIKHLRLQFRKAAKQMIKDK